MTSEKENDSLMDQYKCPIGDKGRTVAASMNKKHNALASWGLKKVGIKPDFNILDVGCGGGKTIRKLAKLAFHGEVFGIDHSPDMVVFSREVNRELIAQNRVSIIERSIENTGFPDDFFDLVTAIETYYFWSNLTEAFREINRILKPKGKLILINEMIKNGIYEIENAEIIAKANVNLVDLKEIEKILRFVGFMNIKTHTKKGSPFNAILAQKI